MFGSKRFFLKTNCLIQQLSRRFIKAKAFVDLAHGRHKSCLERRLTGQIGLYLAGALVQNFAGSDLIASRFIGIRNCERTNQKIRDTFGGLRLSVGTISLSRNPCGPNNQGRDQPEHCQRHYC
jgi:hypothetical protein